MSKFYLCKPCKRDKHLHTLHRCAYKMWFLSFLTSCSFGGMSVLMCGVLTKYRCPDSPRGWNDGLTLPGPPKLRH